MNRTIRARTFSVVALAFFAAGGAFAGEHPAVLVKNRAAAINPDTFIVGHPASPTWVRGHANHEHPAVVAAREAGHRPIDTNAYLVQPPATTTWTLGPAADETARVALR